jgi:hypothetical protein
MRSSVDVLHLLYVTLEHVKHGHGDSYSVETTAKSPDGQAKCSNKHWQELRIHIAETSEIRSGSPGPAVGRRATDDATVQATVLPFYPESR